MATVMKILTGPPGTGKTYRAVDEAVRAVDGTLPPGGRAGLMARHRALVQSGQIVWVTFHPSYSYEDFVEGYRPVEEKGTLVYRVVRGPFLAAAERCVEDTVEARFRSLSPGTVLKSTNVSYEVLEADPAVVHLESAVNRKDAISDRKIAVADVWTIRRLVEAKIKPTELSFSGQQASDRATVARRAGVPSTLLSNSGHLRAVVEYIGQPTGPRNVVLVIDELNRADLSRVFGELITLLEINKRAGADDEREVVLPYSRQRFTVPDTLSVIGTMNTADRSLAEIDLALRRRFDFVPLDPQPDLCPSNWGGIDVADWLRRRNRALGALGLGENAIGHSELMEYRLTAVRKSEGWRSTNDGKRRTLAHVLRTKILPLLTDLFRTDWRQAEAVLGRHGLLEEASLGQDELAVLDEYVYGDEPGGFRLAPWSDPRGAAWAHQTFAAAMKP